MNKGALILAMFLVALGGGMLHYRVHPPLVDVKPQFEIQRQGGQATILAAKKFSFSHGLASIFSLIDIFLITTLFLSRRTVIYGFLLKGIFTIFAVVLMSHFSIAGLLNKNTALLDWVFKSTLPDSLIALGGFLIAKAVYDSYFKKVI